MSRGCLISKLAIPRRIFYFDKAVFPKKIFDFFRKNSFVKEESLVARNTKGVMRHPRLMCKGIYIQSESQVMALFL